MYYKRHQSEYVGRGSLATRLLPLEEVLVSKEVLPLLPDNAHLPLQAGSWLRFSRPPGTGTVIPLLGKFFFFTHNGQSWPIDAATCTVCPSENCWHLEALAFLRLKNFKPGVTKRQDDPLVGELSGALWRVRVYQLSIAVSEVQISVQSSSGPLDLSATVQAGWCVICASDVCAHAHVAKTLAPSVALPDLIWKRYTKSLLARLAWRRQSRKFGLSFSVNTFSELPPVHELRVSITPTYSLTWYVREEGHQLSCGACLSASCAHAHLVAAHLARH